MQDNSLFEMRNYGRIKIVLREKMDEKQINRNKMAQAIGSRFDVVNKWYRGEVERLDLDILARMCCVLECQVEDLLVYIKETAETDTNLADGM